MSEEPLQNAESVSPIAQMLRGVLSDPEKMKQLNAVMGALSSAPPPEAKEAAEEAIPTASSTPDAQPLGGGDGLASLLSNPNLLQQLPQVLSVMRPLLASMPPPTPAPSKKELGAQDCRDNLLLALKPFLSPERRDAVDTIIRISRLGAVFQQLK